MRFTTRLRFAAAALALAAPAAAHESPACDRACLIAMADGYLAAMIARDPAKAPLASNVVMVENAKRIRPGEGLWASLTGAPEGYKIPVADPVSQQVGVLTVATGADGKPTMFSVRLKRGADGRIAEAEHIVGNALGESQVANLRAPRPALLREVPYEYADSRGRMIWLGKSYYDALDGNNSRLSAMADDCERRENGFQTARNPMIRPTPAGPANGQTDPIFAYLGGLGCAAQMDTNMWEYIDTIDERRVEIADPVTGLVWGQSHFRHDMKEERYRLLGIPGAEWRVINRAAGAGGFDMPAVHIYKVWGGQIHEIEAVGWTAPYKSPTWSELSK